MNQQEVEREQITLLSCSSRSAMGFLTSSLKHRTRHVMRGYLFVVEFRMATATRSCHAHHSRCEMIMGNSLRPKAALNQQVVSKPWKQFAQKRIESASPISVASLRRRALSKRLNELVQQLIEISAERPIWDRLVSSFGCAASP